jgi:hypothetical protein
VVARHLKEHGWKELTYLPEDLALHGVVGDPKDPFHLGHYSHDLFVEVMAAAGFHPVRDRRFRVHKQSFEFFMEFKPVAGGS